MKNNNHNNQNTLTHTWGKKAPWLRLLVRFLFLTIGFAFVSIALNWLWYLFAPLVLALGLATVLHPWMSTLEAQLGWKRQRVVCWSLFLVILSFVMAIWVIVPKLWVEFWTLVEYWETILPEVIGFLAALEEAIAQWIPLDSTSWVAEIGSWLAGFIASFLEKTGSLVAMLPDFMIQFLVFSLSLYFFTCDYPSYQQYWREKVNPDALWLLGRVKSTVVTAFAGYLKTQLLLSSGVFLILLLGFWCIRQKFSFFLAFSIAVLDFIPLIGAGLLLLPWAVFCMLTSEVGKGVIILGLWAVTAVFRRLLEPKILGQQTGLSPLLSLGSMYVGLQVAGVWGLIFAPVVVLVLLHFFGVSIFHGLVRDLNLVGLDLLELFEEEEKISD